MSRPVPLPARFECDIFRSANRAAEILLRIAFDAFLALPVDFFLFCELSRLSESDTTGGADGGPVPREGEMPEVVTISMEPVFITRESKRPDFLRAVGAEVVGLVSKVEGPGVSRVTVEGCRFEVIVVVEVSLKDVVGDGVVVVAVVSSSGSTRVF